MTIAFTAALPPRPSTRQTAGINQQKTPRFPAGRFVQQWE